MSSNLGTLFAMFPRLRMLFETKSDGEFDAFLDMHFEQCVQRMEAEAQHLANDSEEKLSAFLAAALSIPGLSVMREGYSNGRVDLTIRSESLLIPQQRLAEAKVYGGHAYHAQAITTQQAGNRRVTSLSTSRSPRSKKSLRDCANNQTLIFPKNSKARLLIMRCNGRMSVPICTAAREC
jgi:hypothetical protein